MAVLLLLVALIAPGFAQNCPPSPGQCPCDYNTLFRTGYLTYASPIANEKKLDNVCYTYFPVDSNDPCTYVAYFVKQYCDGSKQTLSFLASCNSTNQVIYTSPSCSFVETKLGRVGQTDVYVRSITSGACTEIIYPALASSLCPNDGSSSELDQVNQLLSNNGYGCTILYEVPKKYPGQCITYQNSTNTGGDTSKCPGPNPCPCYGSAPSNYYPSNAYYSPPSSCQYYN